MRNTLKALFIGIIMGLLIIRPTSAYADWNGHDGHGHDGGSGRDDGHGHDRDHHDRSFIGIDFSVWPNDYNYGTPYYPYYPADAVLVSPPVYEQPVTVVQQPVTIVQPSVAVDNQLLPADAITINIPNNKGGYTAVTLKKSGNGFIGPQGEFYPEFPTVVQLKVIYGK